MYTEFNASECHKTTWYETPICLMVMTTTEWARTHEKPASLIAHEAREKASKPRADYPRWLLREFNGVLCETL